VRRIGGSERIVEIAPVETLGAAGAGAPEDAHRIVDLDVVPVLIDREPGDCAVSEHAGVDAAEIRTPCRASGRTLVAVEGIFDADVRQDAQRRARVGHLLGARQGSQRETAYQHRK
jgi:hypothetical protein